MKYGYYFSLRIEHILRKQETPLTNLALTDHFPPGLFLSPGFLAIF